MVNPQHDYVETPEETRKRLRQQINALHKRRGTYAAYHDATRADQLLPAIAELERQLVEAHKKPTTQEESNSE